jgi:hypothetical protein
MRKIGAVTGVVALAAIALTSPPAAAFGVRVGPFYFGIPFLGHRRHHHHHVVHAERPSSSVHSEAVSGGSTQAGEPGPRSTPGLDSPLLYPALALPAVYDNVFWPSAASPWPFSYDAIFHTAFAKPHPHQSANACPAGRRSTVVGERIRREIAAGGVQLQHLQRLDGALAMAANYLTKACPTDMPSDPAARLQLMEWQIEKLSEALDMVRPPLQAFEQSLNASERSRFAGTTGDGAQPGGGDGASACAAQPTTVDASVEQIAQSVQATDAQREAVTAMKQALRNAATELDANCSLPRSPSPLARLEAIQSRLDSTWRAVLAIQVALDTFTKQLDDQQRARLDAADFASAQ